MKKSIALITAAVFIAIPSFASAQVSTGALTDKVKDKAVDTVLDNATTDDALIVGKTLLKGGSKEDAAIAVVKGRAENKVEGFTGTNVDLDDLSKDGVVDAGKDVAIEKAKGSATSYGDKAAGSHIKNSVPVIPKSGATITTPGPTPTTTTTPTAPLNCPSGTKDAGDGTCMFTGDWKF